jgi:RHS repeat-associated protein
MTWSPRLKKSSLKFQISDFTFQIGIRVLQGITQVGEYIYKGAGQRIKKVTQTETRIFHYDLRGHLIAETSKTGQMLAEYIYLGDQFLSMIKPGESVYYFHNDHLGAPQVLTNDSQAIAWKAVYTPFGDAVPSIQTVENPFRFPGQYYDTETGLHYNYFRYYIPQTGRYITPDPIGLEGGVNLFVGKTDQGQTATFKRAQRRVAQSNGWKSRRGKSQSPAKGGIALGWQEEGEAFPFWCSPLFLPR